MKLPDILSASKIEYQTFDLFFGLNVENIRCRRFAAGYSNSNNVPVKIDAVTFAAGLVNEKTHTHFGTTEVNIFRHPVLQIKKKKKATELKHRSDTHWR